MPRPKKTRHGATQPETARENEQLLLRLPPEMARRIEAMAAQTGWTKSQVVMAAIQHVYATTIWWLPESGRRLRAHDDAAYE